MMRKSTRLGFVGMVVMLTLGVGSASAVDGDDRGISAGTSDDGVDLAALEQLRSSTPVAERGQNIEEDVGSIAARGPLREAVRRHVRTGDGKTQVGQTGRFLGQCVIIEAETGSTCPYRLPLGANSPAAVPQEVPAGADPVEVTLTRSEAASLLVNTGEAMMDGRWQLANMPVLLWTTASEHTVSADLLGQQVDVRFSPLEFEWDPTDGSHPFVTSDPGAPYPEHTVSYPYPDGHESIHVELTTLWEAEFRVGGGDWEAIDGTIPITTRTQAFEVRERQVRLVPECAVHDRC
ncbi:hypothetical protein ACPYO6_02095 [Georgenia sp. Z1344]|uniref:hypothetical protein n=1 Tax=Georgenia sp. Z1344 TaxID=3416706 RepID=UPI003CEE0B09